MAGIAGTLVAGILARLRSPVDGVNLRIGAVIEADPGLNAIGVRSISGRNISVDLAEKSENIHYPALLVYSDKVHNQLKEKFRQFSGTVRLVIEIRHTQDRIDGIEERTQLYVDSVCALLDDSRGNWPDGAFYSGGYTVSYEAVSKGGKNFMERAKVSFEVEVSK